VHATLSEDLYMQSLIQRLRREEEGATLVEYGLLVGLIAVVCVAAVTLVGTDISTVFTRITTALAGAIGA
jgi:pilus assembly protein Flp/PilA